MQAAQVYPIQNHLWIHSTATSGSLFVALWKTTPERVCYQLWFLNRISSSDDDYNDDDDSAFIVLIIFKQLCIILTEANWYQIYDVECSGK